MQFAETLREEILLRHLSILNVLSNLNFYFFLLWIVLESEFFYYCDLC